MTSFVLNFFRLFAVLVLFFCSHGVSAQENGIPFPKPTEGFKPKVTYEMDLARAWKVVTTAINDNQIQIDSASKDTNQITTGYRMGPSEGGGFFGGPLVTQYRYLVSLIPISSSQTQIKVSAALQARRLAATMGKIMSGNNALSDVNWIDATADNPDEVTSLQNWLYEQIEQKKASVAPSASTQPTDASPAPQANAAPPTAVSIEDQLEKLHEMRRKNIITEAEYKAMRAKALGL